MYSGGEILAPTEDNLHGITRLLILHDDRMVDLCDFEMLIQYAVQHGIDICYCFNDWDKNASIYKVIMERNNISPINKEERKVEISADYHLSGNSAKVHPTTVLAVGGVVEEADTFAVFSKIIRLLKNYGVKVSAIGKPGISEYMGFHTYHKSFFAKDLDEEDKVLRLNHYIANIIEAEHPQVLIIQMPDSIIRLSQAVPNGYGIKSFMLAQSTRLHGLICCVPKGYLNEGLSKELNSIFIRQFGCRIIDFHSSNYTLDYQAINGDNTYNGYYVPIDEEDAHNLLTNNNIYSLVVRILNYLRLRPE